ncbi:MULTISPECIES: deoxyguanosinetriphosphate triphosphohydrolase [Clostridia]|uniref:Deoxyguanosinetriphosphate triphosphohydrolase n=3 Tax=Clostridia TaxID=186801 RepID=A0A8I0DNM0_9CLOT|nr:MULTISPECIES: deoxyguanosinetriphosphate triphosphohydrolase [Clostridia]MBC5639281.1 deoxyguanosinetriphosphate triphosphohydrolase [Clostridium lentum]MBC5653373.1 deoxyguanosinetriphosphate triphosphohydrolase [Blautia lenta]
MSKFKWEKILNKKRIRDYKINKKSSDCRDEFENDYDRILFSASFRRLQDKAQVFPLEKLDFVRTRLTHSLEVSSIGKSLGISIGSRLVKKTINYEEKVTISMVEDISNILACAGLIHDLGNPPFGHFGEVAIREWFKNKLCKNEDGSYNFKYDKYDFNLDKQEALDLLNFEGNAQGLRILTKLHFVIDRYGMNLTTGVLSAIIKYPISSLDKENSNLKKIGYYKAEEKIFKEIAEDTDIWKCRNPLVYILEAADDIAYLLGDLEDAFNKKIITHDIFKMKYEEFIKEEGYEEKTLEESLSFYLSKNYNIAKEEYGYEDPGEYALKSFIIKLNRYLKDSVIEEFINSYDEIMDGVYEGDLISNSKANKISLFLRSISKEYVYTNEKIVANEIVGYNIIHNLLDIFVPAALNKEVKPYKGYDGKLYSLISKNYRFVCENNIEQKECSEEYSRLLLVTDFICGMTDSYAAYLYEEINGVKA